AHSLGNWNLALVRWENAISKFPHYFNFYVQKGNVLITLFRYREAEILFDELISKYPHKHHDYDRILAQTVGLIYYWIIAFLYAVAPSQAYFFMEEVEKHAFHTYDNLLTENEAELKEIAAPEVAIKYYRDEDFKIIWMKN
ncbi:alternative oxidase, partial [Dapis sp. BLCC M229]|uniref:alternative oxidase n=1 Tax=Dapis sp. BLCC M229 TaxID=3400188 RepID=UPI003CF6416D